MYGLRFGVWYSSAHLEELAWPSAWQRIAAGENSPRRTDLFLKREILHPYVGFLLNAERPESHGFASSIGCFDDAPTPRE